MCRMSKLCGQLEANWWYMDLLGVQQINGAEQQVEKVSGRRPQPKNQGHKILSSYCLTQMSLCVLSGFRGSALADARTAAVVKTDIK